MPDRMPVPGEINVERYTARVLARLRRETVAVDGSTITLTRIGVAVLPEAVHVPLAPCDGKVWRTQDLDGVWWMHEQVEYPCLDAWDSFARRILIAASPR